MDNLPENDKYIGRILDGRYEILERIGSGGMSVVYKALCHRLNRYDAIKILRDDLSADGESRERFQAESQASNPVPRANRVKLSVAALVAACCRDKASGRRYTPSAAISRTTPRA